MRPFDRAQSLTETDAARLWEVVAGLGVIVAYTAVFLHWNLVVDDAFISFRYAEHLRTTGELVFNAGERVEGYSNLSWTLALVCLGGLGIGPDHAAVALGFFAGLGTLLLVKRVARSILGLGSASAWVAAALCAVNTSFSFWAASGLESALFACLLVLTWAALGSATTVRGAIHLGLLALLLGLTRPEGMVIAVCLPLIQLGRRVPARAVATLCLVVCLSLGAFELWRTHYYGSLLPNAVVAKMGFSPAVLGLGLRYLWRCLSDERILLLAPLWLVGWPRVPRSLLLLLLGYTLLVVAAGGDGLYRYRFAAHVMPLVALATAAGIDRILGSRPRLGALVALGAVAVVMEPLTEREFFARQSLAAVRDWEARWTRVGRALARAVPREAWLATNVAGRVPYFSGLPTLDLLGLTDAVIARHATPDLGRGYAGHERAAPEYVLSRRPEIVYLSVLDGLPARALASPALTFRVLGAGSLWRYAPLVGSDTWHRAYRPALLRLGDGSTAGLFVLRGGRVEQAAGPGIELVDLSSGQEPAEEPAENRGTGYGPAVR
jgi:arabinofuranosyltransferase